MVDLSNLATLPIITKFIERCIVTAIPAGALPKDITVQLPDADGARIPVRYTGFPPGLSVNDKVSIRATPQDTIRYVIDGTSGATAPKVGKKLDHVLFVSSTAPNADYSTIADANAAANAGDIILLDAETWGSAVITKAVTLMGLDPVNTILTTSDDDSNTLRLAGANGITVSNLTLNNTGAGTTCTCLDLTQGYDNLIIDNVIMNKTSGAPTNSYGIYNINGTNILLNNVRVTVTTGTNRYGYYSTLTTGSSARIAGGSYDGSTDDIRLDDAQASVELNDPILENDDLNIVAGSASGGYFNADGDYRILEDGASQPATKLGVEGAVQATGMLRGTAWLTGGETGQGLEIGVFGSDSFVHAYDRTAAAYKPLKIVGSTVDIRIGANNALSIDANRIVTMPAQPSFLAYNSATDSNVTGDGTAYTVEFNTEVYDRNADYNNTTDTFTAPVTGIYSFVVSIYLGGIAAGHTTTRIWLATSNWTVYLIYNLDASAAMTSTSFMLRLPGLVDMDASDTATVVVSVAGGAKAVAVNGGANIHTSFAGCLLH